MAHRFSWLGLALELRILADSIIRTVESDGVEDDKAPGQLLLFPIDMKTRDRFHSLALTFDACLLSRKEMQWGPLRTSEMPYLRYDMFDFVRRIPDERWEPVIDQMLRIYRAEGLTQPQYFALLDFFTELESRAIHLTRSARDGCF
jgi:hypothetical protein